jgi:23S rRNA (adenine2503-C2)-methyltransferase
MKQKINLKDLLLPELEDFIVKLGGKQYRTRQVAEWIFKKGVASFQEMTNIPLDLRKRLALTAFTGSRKILLKKVSPRGDTVKYLFGLHDGQAVESVLMKHDYGNSACVSTQIGCRMGCRLCASGLEGLVRNLSAGEIYDQVLGMQHDAGERVSHVVVMGSGEPLDNYTATLTFIKNITASYGLNISCRRITVSTCGLVPGIKKLSMENLPLTLAVSLHAAGDRLRDTLVPVNKKYPLAQLMAACRAYIKATGRRITFEYALLAGVNDGIKQAEELGRLLKGMLCHVNLIPANPVPERGVEPPSGRVVELFKEQVEKYGIATTVRRELGADINAACGQLRRKEATLPGG